MPLSIKRLLTPRFSIKSLLVLVLGIAIGYSLNLYTLRVLMGPGSESAMKALPTYVIEPPDVVAIDVIGEAAGFASVAGKHLVGPDGRVSLGEHGSLYIAGLTLEEARAAIEKKLTSGGQGVKLAVDVADYNSKKYYVITKSKKFGDNILQLPITGNDTVLDALANVDGVKSVDTKIYISRPSAKPNGVAAILPVIYEEVVRGVTRTNYQLLPGDRLFVEPPTKATPAPAPSGFQPTRQPPPTPAPNYYSYVRPQL